jgi:RNA polymerase sigma-70 factor (ECF subfamily)
MSTFLAILLPPGLLERARDGERDAQEAVYRLAAGPVYTLLRRLVLRPAVAEELLQEVFIDVLRNLRQCQGAATFPGWVRSIAVSKALMHLRSPWHGRLLSDEDGWLDAVPANTLAATDSAAWSGPLERALNALPALTRSIVWLHDVEGYTHAEIAKRYGRRASFSKSQLARAHESLRAMLEPESVLTSGVEEWTAVSGS